MVYSYWGELLVLLFTILISFHFSHILVSLLVKKIYISCLIREMTYKKKGRNLGLNFFKGIAPLSFYIFIIEKTTFLRLFIFSNIDSPYTKLPSKDITLHWGEIGNSGYNSTIMSWNTSAIGMRSAKHYYSMLHNFYR